MTAKNVFFSVVIVETSVVWRIVRVEKIILAECFFREGDHVGCIGTYAESELRVLALYQVGSLVGAVAHEVQLASASQQSRFSSDVAWLALNNLVEGKVVDRCEHLHAPRVDHRHEIVVGTDVF